MSRPSPVPDWVPADLPAAPGVYQFEDAFGTPLYVGKSVNLRRRVRGYFYGGGPDDGRLTAMLGLASSVRFEAAGTDLEARLEEAERIQRHRPPFNRALKYRARGWLLELDWTDPFPRLRVVRAARRSGARYFGPFRGRRRAMELADAVSKLCRLRTCQGRLVPDERGSPCLQFGLGHCTAPCVREANLNAYRAQVRAAERLLEDGRDGHRRREEVRAVRDRAAARLAYEEAAGAQREMEWLDRLDHFRHELDRPETLRSWLIVLPAARADVGVVVPMARGRVLPRRTVEWTDPAWEDEVEDACYAVRVAELRSEAVFPASELIASLIVSRWLASGSDEGIAFDLRRMDAAEVRRRLRAGPAPSRGPDAELADTGGARAAEPGAAVHA